MRGPVHVPARRQSNADESGSQHSRQSSLAPGFAEHLLYRPWLSDAKLYFSEPNYTAYRIAKDYVNGSPIRQEYLETAIEWIAARDGLGAIEEYMALPQQEENANQIWLYFRRAIE